MREWEATAETVAFCSLPYGVSKRLPKRLAPFLLGISKRPASRGCAPCRADARRAIHNLAAPHGYRLRDFQAYRIPRQACLRFPGVPRPKDACPAAWRLAVSSNNLAAPHGCRPRDLQPCHAPRMLTVARGYLPRHKQACRASWRLAAQFPGLPRPRDARRILGKPAAPQTSLPCPAEACRTISKLALSRGSRLHPLPELAARSPSLRPAPHPAARHGPTASKNPL